MKNKIKILNADLMDTQLLLQTDQPLEGLQPKEQILADTDNHSFIYLMEDEADYTYIILPEPIWPIIKMAHDNRLPVTITDKNEIIELLHFHDELDYLVTNISGNSNYGREFVQRVAGIFET